jgi:hypothetical protein
MAALIVSFAALLVAVVALCAAIGTMIEARNFRNDVCGLLNNWNANVRATVSKALEDLPEEEAKELREKHGFTKDEGS